MVGQLVGLVVEQLELEQQEEAVVPRLVVVQLEKVVVGKEAQLGKLVAVEKTQKEMIPALEL